MKEVIERKCCVCPNTAKIIWADVPRERHYCSEECCIVWFKDNYGWEFTKEDMNMFDLKGYTPEKVTDNFGVFKGKYDCCVNSAKIEEYSGDNEEFKGMKFFKYEIEVLDGQENAGRRLWKSCNLDSEIEDKKGKTPIMKLADAFFTLELEFSDEDELQACAEKFVEMTLRVYVDYFVPKGGDKDDPIQFHKLLDTTEATSGKVEGESASPF